ncbi:MAG: transketolase [Candidatus Nanoarchaeia archaeon]|nr:transketolase [Candidatus Nanoarchaeia archaeon]MDD5358118.1 transketolase [Candidatus Nanoarchaeia archaeon]MDD5589305.1 transketolase [Candidatus Nanoarchaeia archaeon]
MDILELEFKARELRKKVLDLSMKEGEAHLGGSFSEIEILVSLYNKILQPEDKFILSKGHASTPFYLLLREKGYNPIIQTHPDLDEKNGIFATTGSLGHGLPIAVGMALARKKMNRSGRIYVLLGDGECQEGTIWEAADVACHYRLDNLTVIVDHNKLQALCKIEEISPTFLKSKFQAFGCYVTEIDGHNFKEIISAFENTPAGKPYVIIANTVKGKGVSYMQNDPKWHTRLPNEEELRKAYDELK